MNHNAFVLGTRKEAKIWTFERQNFIAPLKGNETKYNKRTTKQKKKKKQSKNSNKSNRNGNRNRIQQRIFS